MPPTAGTAQPLMDGAAARAWETRWDQQQERYIASRERRFDFMIDVVVAHFGNRPRVIDLGCGLGSMLRRFAARVPDATLMGVDSDPVLLALAQALNPTATLIDADLAAPAWWQHAGLQDESVDAFVSSTALHWLTDSQIETLTVTCYRLLRPGGLWLNADHLQLPGSPEVLGRLALKMREDAQADPHLPGESWTDWWDAVVQAPALGQAVSEREARIAKRTDFDDRLPKQDHYVAALRTAGFSETADFWREHGNVVLVALKKPASRAAG